MQVVDVSQIDALKMMGRSNNMKEPFRIRYIHVNITVSYSYENPNVTSWLTWRMIGFEVCYSSDPPGETEE